MFPNRSYPYLYYTVTPLFFLVHMQSRHTVSDVYKDPCIAVESSVRLQPTCSYHLSLRIGEPDCCAFTCCTTKGIPKPLWATFLMFSWSHSGSKHRKVDIKA